MARRSFEYWSEAELQRLLADLMSIKKSSSDPRLLSNRIQAFCDAHRVVLVDPSTGDLNKDAVVSLLSDCLKTTNRVTDAGADKITGYRDEFLILTQNLDADHAVNETLREKYFKILVSATDDTLNYVAEADCANRLGEANDRRLGYTYTSRSRALPASVDELRVALTEPKLATGGALIIPVSDAYATSSVVKPVAERLYKAAITNGVKVYTSDLDKLIDKYAAFRQAHPGDVVDDVEDFFKGERGSLATDPRDVTKLVWVTKPDSHGTATPINDFASRMAYVSEDPTLVDQRIITRADLTALDRKIDQKEATYAITPPVTTSNSEEYTKSHGFFARIGRWALRHPVVAGLLAAAIVIVPAIAINSFAFFSFFGANVLATAGSLAGIGAGFRIARGISAKYREFIYNYDIEKNFVKSFKQRDQYERQKERLTDVLGRDGSGNNVLDDIIAAPDDATKNAEIQALNAKTRKSASRIAKTMNRIDQKNQDTIATIRDLTGKKRSNAKTMGMDAAARDAHVEAETKGINYEEDERNKIDANVKHSVDRIGRQGR